MLEQLKELLEMQRVLDENIYTTHNVEYDEKKSYLALIDEIGELNHELKAEWCWWKKTVKPVDREKVLEELVDVWHFALSIFYQNHCGVGISKQTIQYFEDLELCELYLCLIRKVQKICLLEMILALTYKLGFDFEDVYKCYKKKNEVNWQRLKNNY